MSREKLIRQASWTLLPAFLILALVAYLAFSSRATPRHSTHLLEGKALAAYASYYPVRVTKDGSLYLDPVIFMKAVDYFSKESPGRAAGELIYLGQQNGIALRLNDDEKLRYANLLKNPLYEIYKAKNPEDPLLIYKNIVDGIGQTLNGTGIELVLHDTRNPLKSVVAIQNAITGRRLGDPNTNFGYELIRNYAALEDEGVNYISYALTTKDGRKVKSSTIPIYQEKNLIGFICLNIDISQLDGRNRDAESAFIAAFTKTSSNEKINEILENTNRNLAVSESHQ